MVNLRYHIVSLAAVLLALAAGVLLGAGPLANAVDTAAGSTPAARTGASTGSAASVGALQAATGYQDAVAAAVSRRVVHNTLTGQRVVLVTVPGAAPGTVTAVSNLLRAAGATLTGQVGVGATWVSPDQATVLAGITQQLAPATTAVGTGSPASAAASALAASLLTTKSAQLGRTSDPATALLAGLVQAGFVTVTGTPAQAAGLAVLIGPATPRGGSAWLPLADALAAAGSGLVVGAPQGSSSPGGLIGALRADPASRAVMSTLDCTDLGAGRIALVLALQREASHHHGQYGLGPGADAPLPTG